VLLGLINVLTLFFLTSLFQYNRTPPSLNYARKRELRLGGQVLNWSDATQLGEAFSSSTIFKLPLGGKRSPDVAWVERSRWDALTLDEQEKFPPLAPDFVIELRSRTDDLSDLQEKMIEYRDNGVKLGWLINPPGQTHTFLNKG
jgi:Uma2 family endonuclease